MPTRGRARARRRSKGKASASRSALRHGLSIPVLSDPDLAKKVQEFALKIAGENASPCCSNSHARLRRHRSTSTAHEPRDTNSSRGSRATRTLTPPSLTILQHLPYTRHETGSSITWRYSRKDFINDSLGKIADGKKRGGEKFAATLANRVFTYKCLDRYERRARSRLKSATRAFDAARVEAAQQGLDT